MTMQGILDLFALLCVAWTEVDMCRVLMLRSCIFKIHIIEHFSKNSLVEIPYNDQVLVHSSKDLEKMAVGGYYEFLVRNCPGLCKLTNNS